VLVNINGNTKLGKNKSDQLPHYWNGFVGVAWGIWAVTALGMRLRWLSRAWTILIAVIFGGISFFVVYCYGVDQGWFPHW